MTQTDVYRPVVNVQRDSKLPLHAQISLPMEQAIKSGAVVAGQRIENEVSLAQRLNVSRPTARRALQTLVDQGLVTRRRGIGTIVSPERIRRQLELTSLHDDLTRSGHTSTTRLLSYEIGPTSSEITAILEIPEGSDVLMLRRLRFVDGEPLALMRNYLPLENSPSAGELENRGLYDLLRERGVGIYQANQVVGARRAQPSEAKLLELGERASVLTVARTTSDEMGVVVEYGSHIYRPDRYQFEVTLTAQNGLGG